MVLSWAVLAPLAVLIARFLKVLPGQDWPRELDSRFWWLTYWIGQSLVVGIVVIGLVLLMLGDLASVGFYGWLGYAVLIGAGLQVLLEIFLGSKGGYTAPASDGSLRGHHYDMTPRRLLFEILHKSIGYGVLIPAIVTIFAGLWTANAPIWMWLVLTVWLPCLGAVFVALQRQGMAVNTYQAIWGDAPRHPGNRRPSPGWGMRRLVSKEKEV